MKIADYGKAITSYIESPTTAQKLQAKEKALLLAERDNVNTPDLEQSPDSFLRPGETLEDFDVTFRRPNSIGGRVRLSNGTKPSAEEAVTQQQIDYTKAKEKPFTLDQFKNKADAYVGALFNNALPLADIKSALNKFTQKGIDDGTFTADEAIEVVQDLRSSYRDRAQKQRLRGVIEGVGERKEFAKGTPINEDVIKLVKKYRIEDKMGSGMISDALKKNNNIDVGRSTITKLLKRLKDQGVKGIDIPMSELASSVAQRLDPNIPPVRGGKRKIYKVVRPVRELDLKQNPTIPKNAKFKVQLPSGSADGPSTVTKYFKTKEAAEAGIKKAEANLLKAKKLRAKPFDDAVKAIHNIALESADEINDVKNLSKLVYGDSSLKNIQNISNDLVKYQEFLLGFREVPGLKTPNVNQLDEIFAEFPSQNQWGQFAGEELRRSKLKIRDNILKTKGEKLFTTRQKILKAIDTGVFNLDEAMGLSATFENAPGYTELGQIIKKKVNTIKGNQIDGPFSRLFPKVLDGTATIQEVESFNKLSSAFQNKHGVDTPLIQYEPGKKLNAKKYISNFSELSEGAQSNIQSLADKGVVLKTKSSPMSTILKGVAKKGAKYIPFIGTGIGIADVAKAKELGVDNPIDLFAAYHISPEVALASKKYREDPEYRAQSRAEIFSKPLDEGTFEAIDEQTSTFGKYNDQIKNIKLP
jgi:hypothetical protein